MIDVFNLDINKFKSRIELIEILREICNKNIYTWRLHKKNNIKNIISDEAHYTNKGVDYMNQQFIQI